VRDIRGALLDLLARRAHQRALELVNSADDSRHNEAAEND
jgi:hypothetical protein